jgi:hypothetical protein
MCSAITPIWAFDLLKTGILSSFSSRVLFLSLFCANILCYMEFVCSNNCQILARSSKKIDDPSMANDADLMEVVRMLDDACKEAGFFYVVSIC